MGAFTWGPVAGQAQKGPPPERLVKFSVIPLQGEKAVTRPSAQVIRNDREWQRFLDDLRVAPGARPTIDFSKQIVLVIFAGEKRTGGYSVEVSRVTDDSQPGKPSKGTVHYHVLAPPAGAMVVQVITYPYVVIQVEKQLDTVTFHRKSARLKVGPDPAGAGAREVTVVPVPSETGLPQPRLDRGQSPQGRNAPPSYKKPPFPNYHRR